MAPLSIEERQLQALRDDARVYPCHTNRASALGDPCERKLVYMRTRWKDAEPPSPELQAIFGLGDLFERHAIRKLEDLGYRIFEQQTALEFPEERITGHIDAMIGHEDFGDVLHVMDVKSCSPYIFGTIESAADLYNHKSAHVRRYPAQIQLYLVMKADTEEQRGLILFINKTSGLFREIWIDLDLDYCEGLLQKASRINRHVDKGTLPDRLPWSREICGRCEYRGICVPDLTQAEALVWMDDPELEEALEERDKLQTSARDYQGFDAAIRDAVKARFERGETQLAIGRFLIKGTQDKRGSWRKKIEVLEGLDNAPEG